jgi:hypothetical protein
LTYYEAVSGVYSLYLSALPTPFEAFCDMAEDDGGWTVIQKRIDGTTDFFRGYREYRDGFGSPDAEHWLGLERLYQMTQRKQYALRVELLDWDNVWRTADYDSFAISAESDGYKLSVSGYHGDAGDALTYHNGMAFSAKDKNSDSNNGICAIWCHGAWWYKDCFHSNLNGKYYTSGAYVTQTGWGDGVVWKSIQNTNFYSLKATVMKVKSKS